MRYSRKVIVGFIVLLAALMSPRLVFGDDDLVRVTPQIAVEQAQAFFDDVSDEPVTACDPVKMVNSDGESIGYIVRAKRDDVNYGYVVFDSERSWWISEYCLAPNAPMPIENTSDEIALLASQDDIVALKFDELSFGIADLDNNVVLDEKGCRSTAVFSVGNSRSGSPGRFEDVFVSPKDLYKQGYVIDASKTISGMITPTQSEVIKETGTYACDVSAMFAVSSHYVTLNRLKLPDLYHELWQLSGTSGDPNKSFDQATGLYFTQGRTSSPNAAPAIKEFCARRGKRLETSFAWYPSWDSFRATADSGNLSFFLGLSGQAMTLMRWLLRDMWLCIIHIQMIRNICLSSGTVGSISCVFFHMTQRFIYRMKGRIVESDGEDDRKRIRKTLGLLCAFLGILVVAAYQPSPSVVGGKDDEHISVEVQTLSDIHNGQFEALMPSGCRKKIDMRRKSSSGYVSGLKAGDKWILVFVEDKELDGTVLYPHSAEKVK